MVEGQGLNITVQSYCDTLDFGLVGCARLVPDIGVLLDDIIDDIEALAALMDVDVPVHLPDERTPGRAPATSGSKAPAKKKVTAKKAPAKKAPAKRATAKKVTAKKRSAKKAATVKRAAKKGVS